MPDVEDGREPIRHDEEDGCASVGSVDVQTVQDCVCVNHGSRIGNPELDKGRILTRFPMPSHVENGCVRLLGLSVQIGGSGCDIVLCLLGLIVYDGSFFGPSPLRLRSRE